MNMMPVDSLAVQFSKSGSTYVYEGVSQQAADDLFAAKSLGSHFLSNIKNSYAFSKVDQ